MKIAIFTDTYLPQINGVVTSIVTFAKEYQKLGHEVFIIAPKIKNYKDHNKNIWRLQSFPFVFQKEYRISLPISLKFTNFKKLEIDVIHAQTPFSLGYMAQFVGWQYKIPVVYTYHTNFDAYLHYVPFVPNKYLKRMAVAEAKRFCNRCTRVIAPSTRIKNRLLKFKVKKPIDIIPTGLDFKIPKPRFHLEKFHKKYRIPKNASLLMFAGRLALEKNIYFLLDSFNKVSEEIKNSYLFIAGDGPEKKKLWEKAKKLNIEDKIIFAGYLDKDELFNAYKAAKVFVFPSRTETQGLTLLECLSQGTPAVCIRAQGVSDILQNEKGGFLTNNDLAEYSQTIIKLLKDENLHMQKSKEALNRAKEFCAENLAKKIIALYQQAIEEKKE